jgi:hypothetical protein
VLFNLWLKIHKDCEEIKIKWLSLREEMSGKERLKRVRR